MTAVIVDAVVGALVFWTVGELARVFPCIGRLLIRTATRLLPSDKQQRYRAEWLAEMDAVPGPGIVKLHFALSVTAGAGVMAYEGRSLRGVRRRKALSTALAPNREELLMFGFVLLLLAFFLMQKERARKEGRPHFLLDSGVLHLGSTRQPDAIIEGPDGIAVIEYKTAPPTRRRRP